MRGFLRVVGLCFGLFAACCFVIRNYDRQEENSLFTYLRRCGDVFCYSGIVPSITEMTDGLALLEKSPEFIESETSPYGSVYLHVQKDHSVALNKFYKTSPYVDDVFIVLRDDRVRAGDVVRYFGAPCYVSNMSSQIMLVYPNAMFVMSDEYSIDLTSEVWLTELIGAESDCDKIVGEGPKFEWRGFKYPYESWYYEE